jgi:hypothetical protein
MMRSTVNPPTCVAYVERLAPGTAKCDPSQADRRIYVGQCPNGVGFTLLHPHTGAETRATHVIFHDDVIASATTPLDPVADELTPVSVFIELAWAGTLTSG